VEKAEVMDVGLVKADIVGQVSSKICRKIGTAKQVVCVNAPLVGYSATVLPRQVAMNDITHAKDGFSPTGYIQEVFFEDIGKDIFKGDGSVLTDNEVLVSRPAGM
jgi:hypothetical protein